MLADGLVPLCDSRVLDKMWICDAHFLQFQPLLHYGALMETLKFSGSECEHRYASIYQMLTAL